MQLIDLVCVVAFYIDIFNLLSVAVRTTPTPRPSAALRATQSGRRGGRVGGGCMHALLAVGARHDALSRSGF